MKTILNGEFKVPVFFFFFNISAHCKREMEKSFLSSTTFKISLYGTATDLF